MADNENKNIKIIRPYKKWSPLGADIFFESRFDLAFVKNLVENTKINCNLERLLDRLKNFDYWYTQKIGDLAKPTATQIRNQAFDLIKSSHQILDSLECLSSDVRTKIYFELRKADAEELKTSLHLIKREASFLAKALESYLRELGSKITDPAPLSGELLKARLKQKRGAKPKTYRTEAIGRIEKIWIEETKQLFPRTFTMALGSKGEDQFVSLNLLFTKTILMLYEPNISNIDIRNAFPQKSRTDILKIK